MRAPFGLLWLACAALPLAAINGTVRVRVLGTDYQGRPGVVLSAEGGGAPSNPSDDTGLTQLPFTYDRDLPDQLSIVVRAPRGLYIISPCDARLPVRNCTGSQCFERVMVVRDGEQFHAGGLRAISASVTHASAPRFIDSDSEPNLRLQALRQVAARVHTDPAALDGKIRNWARSASDPDDRAYAALYVRDWGAAEQDFAALAEQADGYRSADLYQRSAVAGYRRGSFSAAAERARAAAALAPANQDALNLWGLALAKAGDQPRAEAVLRASSDPASLYNLRHLRAEPGAPLTSSERVHRWLDENLRTTLAVAPNRQFDQFQLLPALFSLPPWLWGVIALGAVIFLIRALFDSLSGAPEPKLEHHAEEPAAVVVALPAQPSRKHLTLMLALACVAVAGIVLAIRAGRHPRLHTARPTLAGVVTDGSGRPLDGALIEQVGQAATSTSQANGQFRLTVRRAEGPVLVRVSAAGFRPAIEFANLSKEGVQVKLTAAK